MTLDKNTKVLVTEENQNLVIDFNEADGCVIAKDEDVLALSKRLLAQNKEAYEVLAQ